MKDILGIKSIEKFKHIRVENDKEYYGIWSLVTTTRGKNIYFLLSENEAEYSEGAVHDLEDTSIYKSTGKNISFISISDLEADLDVDSNDFIKEVYGLNIDDISEDDKQQIIEDMSLLYSDVSNLFGYNAVDFVSAGISKDIQEVKVKPLIRKEIIIEDNLITILSNNEYISIHSKNVNMREFKEMIEKEYPNSNLILNENFNKIEMKSLDVSMDNLKNILKERFKQKDIKNTEEVIKHKQP
jgi:hypothetical protein